MVGNVMRTESLARTIGWTAILAAASVASSQTWPDHLVWADRLVTDIQREGLAGRLDNLDTNQPLNRYGGSFGETYVRIRGHSGHTVSENYSRCASFLTLLLNRVYGWSSTSSTGSASPYAYQYNHLFRDSANLPSSPFQRIEDWNQVQPGDVLAVDYVTPPASGEATGHAFIVRFVDFANGVFDAVSQRTTYDVWVVDCSSSLHTFDTRVLPMATAHGAGRGWISVTANQDGTVAGYRWSLGASDFYDQADRDMKIGRFTNALRSFLEVSGSVAFSNSVVPDLREVRFQVRNGGTEDHTTLVEPGGRGRVWTAVAPGTVEVAVKAPNSLRRTLTGVSLTTGGVQNLAWALTLGDVNDDNTINIADFLQLRAAFGSTPASANWNAGADLNGDRSVNLADFLILRSNFGQAGDA
ncbi:MAG: hypothetical protein KIS66_10750 [Fimbriimonadaceae bacterium]|nr:hypothetical protein [Fimbriimonadaceae bacterium]